jgi:hypothetical protein
VSSTVAIPKANKTKHSTQTTAHAMFSHRKSKAPAENTRDRITGLDGQNLELFLQKNENTFDEIVSSIVKDDIELSQKAMTAATSINRNWDTFQSLSKNNQSKADMFFRKLKDKGFKRTSYVAMVETSELLDELKQFISDAGKRTAMIDALVKTAQAWTFWLGVAITRHNQDLSVDEKVIGLSISEVRKIFTLSNVRKDMGIWVVQQPAVEWKTSNILAENFIKSPSTSLVTFEALTETGAKLTARIKKLLVMREEDDDAPLSHIHWTQQKSEDHGKIVEALKNSQHTLSKWWGTLFVVAKGQLFPPLDAVVQLTRKVMNEVSAAHTEKKQNEQKAKREAKRKADKLALKK